MALLDRIHKLAQNNNLSKHEQLVQGVIEAIDMELLKVGDKLPSINAMVRDLGFARKTIVKAYEELKQRGLIESKKLKGYFIISKETHTMLKVALLLFSFQRFQEEFYNAFRNTLGEAYQIDVFFHHNNITLFETIFNNIKGKYGMYVVAPIPHLSTLPLLNSIEPSKLLIIDRYLKMDEAYAYVSQEFRKSTYDNLLTLLPSIKKYKKFVLFFNDGDCPVEILKAYEEFIENFSLAGEVRRTYRAETIEKDNLYFFISDTFLWEVLRDCQSRGYVPGRDVGILSHNDHIVKQIVCGGITTISTDFNSMAVKAAEYVMNGRVVHTILPLKLIDRGSL